MSEFYFDTEKELRSIFSENCGLSCEQYEEISEQFIFLVCDYQEEEPQEAIDGREAYLIDVADFLYNTKAITLKEHYDLLGMIGDIRQKAGEEAEA